MPTKGTYSALNQLRPLENNLQGILNDARRQDNIDRQQDRIDDNAKKKEKEARQTSKINAYDKLKSQKTGYSSIDEGIADYIENKLVTKLDEAYAILEKDPDNFRAKLEIDRITKQPEQLKLLSQALVDRKKDFEEGVASGKYSKTLNKGKLEAFDKLFNDYNFALDYADGKTQLFIDVDGDGINDAEGEGITLGNMFEADKLGEFTPGFSLESYVTKAKEKLSTSETDIQTGLSTERNKGVNETSVSVLETDMNDRFGTSVETMTTAFKSLVQDNLGLELPTTDEEMTAIKDKIKDKIISQVDTEKEVSYDQKTALAIKKENNRKKERLEDKESVTPEISINQNTGEPEKRKVYKYSEDGAPTEDELGEGYVVTFGGGQPIELLKTQNGKQSISNVVVSEDGKVFADVIIESEQFDEELKKSVKTSTKKQNQELNTTQLNNLSRNPKIIDDEGNRFKNGKELKDFLDKKYNASEGKKKSQETTEERRARLRAEAGL